MKKHILKIAVCSLLAAAVVIAPTQGFAQEKKKAAEKKESAAAEPKRDRLPFHGKVASIDKKAKTVTVGERTFQVNSETKISKGGKPATLDDGAVGDEVGGSYKKGDDGKLTALMMRFGPKPDAEPKADKKEKK